MIKIPKLPQKLIYSIAAIALVGVLFGTYFASKGNIQPTNEVSVENVTSNEGVGTFGTIFNNFILGRSADGSSIGSKTPLVRATKFSTGEKIGLRIQTSSEITTAFPIELRFLTQDTGEETPDLQSSRQKFSIKPGLRSYCCISMPKNAGTYTLGILQNNAFIGTLQGIVVVPAKTDQGGSMLGL